MGEFLRLALVTSDDVVAARRLTFDVAREMGMDSLVQTKLATFVSGLARRSLATAGAGEVGFSMDVEPRAGGRLLVAVCDAGPKVEGTDAPTPGARDRRARPVPSLDSLRPLIGDFELATDPRGGNRVTTTVQLPVDVADDPGLVPRLAALGPAPAPLQAPDPSSVDFLARLDAQTQQLEMTNAELRRVTEERAAVNAELALTNRGVLDLVAELSAANESLSVSGAGYKQLADQQSALADLGHRAVASRDVGLLALGLVSILRRVLGIEAIGVLRFNPGTTRLEVVATDGCHPEQPATIELGGRQARNLRRAGTKLADPSKGLVDFPLVASGGSRSGAVVALHTPVGPWGVLVACDIEEDRFTETTIAFLEAAASLFAFSIARMASEQATQHAAFHDGLTGLPNRAQLLEHLSRALDDPPLEGATSVKPQMAVIFIDIDGFKQVNDTVGHAAGDHVLVEATARLRARTRPTDILSRLGGDEFVVLCEGGVEAAAAIAERLLGAFDDPFVVDGRDMFMSASAGLALAEPGLTSEQILADADIAMYQAKQVPGSASAVFDPEMRAAAELESRLHNEVRRARERGQLRAVYQPIVDLGDGKVRAVEALLRWRHPELGDVPAQRAVAAAARIGLTWDLTCWIAGEAARTVSAWNAANAGHPPLRLAVNFTPLLLVDPRRVGEFAAHVTGAGLPLDLLDVELTETAFADPTPDVLASMAELRSLGARLAMDDFGTGYSSLIALANLPLDVLKIDRSFVTPLDRGGDSVLVSAMTLIAQGRDLETIGEGIETEGQLVALIAAGCDLGQGYLFAKPLEAEQIQGLAVLERGVSETVLKARLAAAPMQRSRKFYASTGVVVSEDSMVDAQVPLAFDTATQGVVVAIGADCGRVNSKAPPGGGGGGMSTSTLTPVPPIASAVTEDSPAATMLRGLLRIRTTEQAARLLQVAAVALGGSLTPAADAGTHALPLDLSLGEGPPLLVEAEPMSAARLQLEQFLPRLVEDARQAVHLLRHNERLEEASTTYRLTGLANNRVLDRVVPQSLDGVVILIDLDHFKQVNDTAGHQAGDEVLADFGRLLSHEARAGDTCCRLGGDEFVVLTPAATITDAHDLTVRLRTAWLKAAPLPVTFSAGVAAIGDAGGAAALASANQALHRAKASGRNRTEFEFASASDL